MKMDCNVIKDLMVLYDVGNCSEESEKLIKEHVEACDDCRKIWDAIGAQGAEVIIEETIEEQSAAEFQHLQRQVKRKNRRQLALYVCLTLVVCGLLWNVVDWLRKPYDLSADEIRISNVYENGEYFGFKVTLLDGKVFVGNTYYSACGYQGKNSRQISMGRDRFAVAAENEAQSSWYIEWNGDVDELYLKNADGTYTLLWEREDGISPLTEEIREDRKRVEQAHQELQ